MSDKKTNNSKPIEQIYESASIPKMQKVSPNDFATNSANIPTMQAAPGSSSKKTDSSQQLNQSPGKSKSSKSGE